METAEQTQQVTYEQVNRYATNLLLTGKNSYEVKQILISNGIDEQTIEAVVSNAESEVYYAKREKGKKDMMYGAMWCIGGILLTVAHIGFIFWGAIVFGGIRFFRGVANYN